MPESQSSTETTILKATESPSVAEIKAKLTKAIAIDCEMVGVGENGKDSILARVSLVNQLGECVYDKYVLPTEKVTDYRTHVSGIRQEDLKRKCVSFFISSKRSGWNNRRACFGRSCSSQWFASITSKSPEEKIRDTQKCKLFRRKHPSIGGLSSLKNLVKILLGINIQEGEHNSVVDAQATMRLYTSFRKEWEAFLKESRSSKSKAVIEKVEIKTQLTGLEGADGIEVKQGNETHKRYVKNKLKKRLNKKSFLKK